MSRLSIVVLAMALLVGCAEEDDTIVNPPPGNENVIVRFFNMVPDDNTRTLVMESGFSTTPVVPGSFSATVQAPADSTILEVFVGPELEFRSAVRARFVRQSVYNVYAVAGHNTPTAFDTVMLSNANRSLTTRPVAQVRAVNLIPDTTVSYDVRIGCPNGEPLSTTPVAFRNATLYSEMPPGFNVFSIRRVTPSGVELLGTYECLLKEFTPYSILIHGVGGSGVPQLILFDEADFTTSAQREFIPVQSRDADMRVANVAGTAATVRLVRTGQVLATSLAPDRQSAYQSVPTCETTTPDVIELELEDGRKATDSTSLTVKGRYTVVAAVDSADSATIVIVPPEPATYGTAGKATLRVVSATTIKNGVSVSVGGRTDASQADGVSTGRSITSRILFDQVSEVAVLEPGEVPLTVSTAGSPSTLLAIRRVTLQPNTAYIVLLSDAPDGTIRMFLQEEITEDGSLEETEHAAFVRFVNGDPLADYATTTIGTVVQNARLYYRNSLATNLALGSNTVVANSVTHTFNTAEDVRSLIVYTIKSGNEVVFDITALPLAQDPAFSERRVINATDDVNLVSVSYDANYERDPNDPNIPHVARQVAFGTTSPTHTLDREIRGSMYVYDYETLELLYTLPIDLGPLGNSYSLIVVGTKAKGYEVIVLQSF